MEGPIRKDGKPVPTIYEALDMLVKDVGGFQNLPSMIVDNTNSTCWTYDETLRLTKNTTIYSNYCKGIYCDKLQCRNACKSQRFLKLEKRKINKK
jgi:hypothetical protein